MRARQSLAFRLVATGIGFLALALASIVLTLWVTWQLEGGAAAVNEAGRMRMMSYRLALDAQLGLVADRSARLAAMDATVELLDAGDPSRPLFVPWDAQSRAAFAKVREQWAVLRADWRGGVRAVPTIEVDALVHHIDGFVSMIERRLSRWTEILRTFQLTMVGLAIASAVLLLYEMHVLVLDPLRKLGQGVGAIRNGNFAARVQVTSGNEFGELAADFNSMAQRLQSLYGDLEAKVAEKTARLEAKREHLAALYEVSAFVAEAENLDELARGFVAKLRRIAGADAVAVRWSDQANERYLMLAQDGLPPSLERAEQCVSRGECHCGQGGSGELARVIPIRTAGGLGHCGGAGFATLITVPLSFQHRMLGEVDVFYRDERRPDDEERSLLQTLASHLAGGMESLRASAASKEAAIANERTLIAQELHDSIAQSLAFLKIQVELVRGAVRRKDDVATARSIAEIDAGVRECYGDVRELLVHFRTRTAGEDIEPALRATLQKFEHQTGLATELQVHGHGVALPPDVQVQVLHVVQEALSNVRKHAHASTVRLHVEQVPQWRFEVIDDGCGFDPGAVTAENHVGLRIMRERAVRIGASVEVHSRPGGGTHVAITVPRRSEISEGNDGQAAAAPGG
jgi:two-component system nitrate/nitrite sensor histidine kinase NarX